MFRASFFLLVFGVLMTGTVFAADPLAPLQWKQRPILVFAKSRSDASLDRQIDLFRERRPDLKERDIVVLRTAGSEETRAVIGYTSLNTGAGRALRQRFQPRASGLTVILVGKDGTEKARWERLVEPQVIFDLIDTMPMRQDEVQSGSAQTN